MKLLAVLVIATLACSSKPRPPATNGSGTGGGAGGSATSCDALRPKLERLYRAEAQATEPKRVEEAVADNTAMVLGDCAKEPSRVIPCVDAASTVADIEARCVRPLDDEGSEGVELRR